MATSDSKTTKDHNTIKKWVEERNGKPAVVKGTEDSPKGDGLLRIYFPDSGKEENLEEVSWERFFSIFDENRLDFLYQEKTSEGKTSRFFKFVRE